MKTIRMIPQTATQPSRGNERGRLTQIETLQRRREQYKQTNRWIRDARKNLVEHPEAEYANTYYQINGRENPVNSRFVMPKPEAIQSEPARAAA